MGRIRNQFALESAKYRKVVITEDGQESEIYVGRMSIDQRDRFFALIKDAEKGGGGAAQAYVVQIGTYEDDKGTRAFSDSDEDFAVLRAAPAIVVQRIAEAVLEFNRLDAVETAVKDAAKG